VTSKPFSLALQVLILSAFLSTAAGAKSTKTDDAPAPPAVPVPKVDQQDLMPPGPSLIEGTAEVIDGDSIRVGDSMVRLYGIAAPAISSPLGPKSRAIMDALVGGQRVSCQVFGKTESGDALAQCKVGDKDPAPVLLAQGLAAVYRTGTAPEDVAQPIDTAYEAAEAEARQAQRGVWQQSPAAAADNPAPIDQRFKMQVLGFAAFALLILALFAISITRVSIARTERRERERLRKSRRFTLCSGLAAEIEIIRAAAQWMVDEIAPHPPEKPIPSDASVLLGLPSAPFWNANTERLPMLPAEVTAALLRCHALHEEATRKLAVAGRIPAEVVTTAMSDLASAADRALAALDAVLGTKREKPKEKKEPVMSAPKEAKKEAVTEAAKTVAVVEAKPSAGAAPVQAPAVKDPSRTDVGEAAKVEPKNEATPGVGS